ncbi:MAG: hypothetical protein ACRDU8_06775, partial [Egibacteraceae bacterium]
ATAAVRGIRGARGRMRRALEAQPSSAALHDIAVAVLAALAETRLVDPRTDQAALVVKGSDDGSFAVGLADDADVAPRDSATLVTALRQVLGPIREPRYLIEWRDVEAVHQRPRWWAPAPPPVDPLGGYRPVPDLLGTNRGRAEALARHWADRVGGGRLVYAASEEGRRVLVAARAQQRLPLRELAFQRWS